ncbi:MAG: sugar transport system permease protein [Solirubrobacteraceae bacterium]
MITETAAQQRSKPTGAAALALAGRLARAVRGDHLGLLVALVVLLAFFSYESPDFFSKRNLLEILKDVSFTAVIAYGMTFVIVAGEIDISVGSAVGFGSALLGWLATKHGWSVWSASAIVLVVGTGIGVGAGIIRATVGVPSFIVTLALFSALSGGAFLLTNAIPFSIDDEAFSTIGTGTLAGIPIPAVVMAVAFVVFYAVARRTTFGRSVYAIGGNANAAFLSGIPVRRVRILLFATTGAMAALSSLMQSSQLGAGNPNVGDGLEFSVIAAVIVGGASLAGGSGSMVGTMLGVLFIGVLNNGMVLIGVNSYAQNVAHGLVVLGAVLLTTVRANRARRATGMRLPGMRHDRESRRPPDELKAT